VRGAAGCRRGAADRRRLTGSSAPARGAPAGAEHPPQLRGTTPSFANFGRARSRLFQNEILQENMRLAAFFKLYKICIDLYDPTASNRRLRTDGFEPTASNRRLAPASSDRMPQVAPAAEAAEWLPRVDCQPPLVLLVSAPRWIVSDSRRGFPLTQALIFVALSDPPFSFDLS